MVSSTVSSAEQGLSRGERGEETDTDLDDMPGITGREQR